jgi:hypothetical protein
MPAIQGTFCDMPFTHCEIVLSADPNVDAFEAMVSLSDVASTTKVRALPLTFVWFHNVGSKGCRRDA